MSNFWKIAAPFISVIIFIVFIVWNFVGAPNNSTEKAVFIIPQNTSEFDMFTSLHEKGLIKNANATKFIFTHFFKDFEIKSGGYNLSSKLSAWQVAKKLQRKPDLVWVNIYYCPRKEQVGEKLAASLEWDSNKLNKWNNLFKNTDYYEGVFYPDTYLIPVNETVEEVADRFIQNFNTKFSPLSDEYIDSNIKWTTGLKIASLIAREAAGREDMHLISGIIWNRLNQDMRLQIDATMQYTLGKNENSSWWGNISLEQKKNDSPYNSYKHEGLPPTPICSPNYDFIEAALNPEETDCLFYLHDKNRQIHCSKTYEGHLDNIRKYLND